MKGRNLLAFTGNDVLRFAVPIGTSSFCTEAALGGSQSLLFFLTSSHIKPVFLLMICLERNYTEFEHVPAAAGTVSTMFTCETRPAVSLTPSCVAIADEHL